MKQLIFVLIITTMLLPLVLAGSTQQYNKIFLNPFYRVSMSQNTNYTYTVVVNPPDGIASVKSAIITFEVWVTPTVTFMIWVNGKACNTPSYQISTTYASAGLAKINFDCSNVINRVGTYTITLRPTQQNTGASTGWLDLTYMNSPLYMGTGGTEYQVNSPARVFARLLDGNSRPVNLGSCNVTVYYPNNTKLINDVQMSFLEKGIYYYDFITPNITGNYITIFDCVFPSVSFSENMTLFHPISTYYSNKFDFDNSDNVTINNAYINISWSGVYLDNKLSYTFYDLAANTTTNVWTLDGVFERVVHDYSTNKYGRLVLSGSLTNGSVVNIYGKSRDIGSANRIIYLTNSGYTTVYGSFNTTSASYEWKNITLANISTPITEIYFYDGINYAGAIEYDYDYIEARPIITTSQADYYFNAVKLGSLYGTGGVQQFILNQSNFIIADNQPYEVVKISGYPTMNWVYLYVNYTYNSPLTTIRGQNEVHVSGNVTVGGNVTVDGGSVDANFYDLRYAGGTEYISGQAGVVAYQFIKMSGGAPSPIRGATCYLDIYYPNNTLFVNQSLMTELGVNGIYYYDYVVPSVEGIYKTDVVCSKGGSSGYGASTFHVDNTLVSVNTSLSNLIVSVNGTIMNKLYLIQGDLSQMNTILNQINYTVNHIDFNTTKLESMITSVNDTVKYVNVTLWGRMEQIVFDVWNYFSRNLTYYPPTVEITNYTVNVTNAIVYNQTVNVTTVDVTNYTINVTNTSIDTSKLEEMIASVNDTVKSVNQTVWDELQIVHDEYFNITQDLQGVVNLIYNVNSTLSVRLDNVKSELNDVQDLIIAHNTTVMNKLYLIQDDLVDITNNVLEINMTTYNKLIYLQQLIEALNFTDVNVTCSNVTASLPAGWCADVGACVVEQMLDSSKILKQKLSNDNYCADNSTLVHNITYEHCGYFGCHYHTDIENEYCQWGCNYNEQKCNPSPIGKVLIMLGIIIGGMFVTKLFGFW